MTQSTRVRLGRIATVVVTALVLTSCGSATHVEETAGSPTASVPVTVAPATETEWPVTYEATGSVKAQTSAALASRIMGYIREVRTDVGRRVQAGQVLVLLDTRDLDAAYRQAEAVRNDARAGISELESAIAGAQATLDLAAVTRKRMRDLFDKRSISNQEFDEADTRFRQAQAAWEGARSRRSRLNDSIATAEAALQSAGVARSFAQIAAPFSGVVVERHAEPGSLASPGVPLLVVEQEGKWRFEAVVEEAKLAQIRLGQTASIELDSVGGGIQAKVSEIVPAIDAGSRSAIVKLDLPARANLRSGAFGRARFSFNPRRCLSVPAAAIVDHGQLQQVFVVTQGVARLRMVTAGSIAEKRREILSGLSPEEMVVLSAPANLVDGARVEVRP